ncbi:MAG: hypothetical protein R6V60_03200 [Desulfobacterales bacterium]
MPLLLTNDNLLLKYGEKVNPMQKKWKKPELIVLQKGQPQEAVLTNCKAPSVSGDPQPQPVGQMCGNDKAGACQNCQARPSKS